MKSIILIALIVAVFVAYCPEENRKKLIVGLWLLPFLLSSASCILGVAAPGDQGIEQPIAEFMYGSGFLGFVWTVIVITGFGAGVTLSAIAKRELF